MGSSEPVFAAIVRTMGDRPKALTEALISLAFQNPPCTAIVVVHADAVRYDQIVRLCSGIGDLNVVLLHAPETARQRGYPLNVALRRCYEPDSGFEYLFFLDDDDIVYPYFTRVLADTFVTSQADVVFAASNKRVGDGPSEAGFVSQPAAAILIENFIPINSFAVRVDSLRAARLLFDENCEIFEDWRYLLALLQCGFRFEAIPQTISEFRVENALHAKYDQALCRRHRLEIRQYINTTVFQIPGPLLVSLLQNTSSVSRRSEGTHASISITALHARVVELENSWSWKVTLPLRKCAGVALRLLRRDRSVRTRSRSTHQA